MAELGSHAMERRWTFALTIIVMVIACARIVLLVSAVPMHGYANQYDMVRTSGCIGLWPGDRYGEDRIQASREAPKRGFVLGDTHEYCVWSFEAAADLLFVGAYRAWSGLGGSPEDRNVVDLRLLGLYKATLLVLVGGWVSWLLRHRHLACLTHASLFLVVISDPVLTLFANTLYTEFFSAIGAYMAIAASVLVMTTGRMMSPGAYVMLVSGVVMLGFSREQYFLLPALLVAGQSAYLVRQSKAWAVIAAVAVSAIPLTYAVTTNKSDARYQANRVDTYIGALLAVSEDRPLTARRLGLGPGCVHIAGANWYSRRGEDFQHACPEVFTLSSLAFANLVVSEPRTLLLAALKAMPMLQQGLLNDLGMIEGREFALLADSPLPRYLTYSLPAQMERLVFVFFFLAMLFCGLFFTAGAFWIAALVFRSGRPAPMSLTALVLIAGVVWYSYGTSVLGDGFADVQRHFHLGTIALSAFFFLFLCVASVALVRGIRGGGRLTPTGVLVVVASMGALVSGPLLVSWVKRQPLGVGLVSTPDGMLRWHSDREIAGWAIDPFGAVAVRLEFSGGETFDIPVGYEGAPLLFRRFYPAYPGIGTAGFRWQIPTERFVHPPAALRVVVINSIGVSTEIDRRQVIAE